MIRELTAALLLASCSPAENAKLKADVDRGGQLFCEVATPNGPAIVGLIDGTVAVLAPEAEPVAIIATDATKAFVDAACAKVAGRPVAPPATGLIPNIPIEPPAPGAVRQ